MKTGMRTQTGKRFAYVLIDLGKACEVVINNIRLLSPSLFSSLMDDLIGGIMVYAF